MIELDWFKRWSLYAPNRVALIDGDKGDRLTYKQCYQKINNMAAVLSHSVKYGDRVAVLAQNSVECVLLLFATQKLGAILVPINFRLSPDEIRHILRDCDASLLIYEQEFADKVSAIESYDLPPSHYPFTGSQNALDEQLKEQGDTVEWEMQGDFEDPCMILYTSGTTGFPKGATLTHKSIFWNSVSTTMRLNLTEQDRSVIFLPMFHTGGWNVLTTPMLHRGASLVITKKFAADQVLKLIEEEQLTILFGVPTTMGMISQADRFKQSSLQSLRYAIVGGEPMPIRQIEIWEKRGVPIRQGYGLTEFGPNVFSLSEQDSVRKAGSIGFPNFYIDVRVVDEQGKDVLVGQIGELILRGPASMLGYWNDPDATAQTIENGWLRTGDLVKFDDDGFFYVVGRKKEMFISGGENVYPAEVERVLEQLDVVNEVAVVGVKDDRWGEVGAAFVSLNPEASLSEEDIVSFCAQKLAKFKVPKHIRFLEDLPKGESGKILKRSLIL